MVVAIEKREYLGKEVLVGLYFDTELDRGHDYLFELGVAESSDLLEPHGEVVRDHLVEEDHCFGGDHHPLGEDIQPPIVYLNCAFERLQVVFVLDQVVDHLGPLVKAAPKHSALCDKEYLIELLDGFAHCVGGVLLLYVIVYGALPRQYIVLEKSLALHEVLLVVQIGDEVDDAIGASRV